MLEIKGLCLQVGSFKVNQISFAVPTSGCHALVGTTGSGKTLVLETVAGLRKAQSGSVYWLGRDITALPPEQRKLAYVPQDLALFPHMTVRENIEYGLRMQRHIAADKYAALEQLTHALGISHLLDRSTKNLSGGERQRIALARALAPGNTLLLLDEPFSALHEAMRKELWVLLKTLQQQYGITVLIVTHDLEEAFFLADTVTFIAHGTVVQSGHKQYVYHCPQNVEAAKFFGVQNLFPAKVIKISADKAELFCSCLNTKLQVAYCALNDLHEKTSVTVGIRSENMIVKAKSNMDASNDQLDANQIVCTVKHIYPKRSSQILLLQPDNEKVKDFLLEADIPMDRTGSVFEVFIGEKVSITLPKEHLLLLTD